MGFIAFAAGATLVVAGLWIVYFMISKGKADDSEAIKLFTFSSLFIVVGLYILSSSISLHTVGRRLTGIALFLLGLYFGVGFPDMGDYHPDDFDMLPMIVGYIIMAISLYFILF